MMNIDFEKNERSCTGNNTRQHNQECAYARIHERGSISKNTCHKTGNILQPFPQMSLDKG